MDIKSFTRSKITEGINRFKPHFERRVRILYVDEHIDESNFDRMCRLYANLIGSQYETVVVVERFPGSYTKLLPMVSNNMFITPIGKVPVNDLLRNDFCDEDDDFFIDDAGYSSDMAVYDQLMMLQCVLDQFSVLSIQMADQRPSIVRELASAITELLRERNALIIVCSDISGSSRDDLIKMEKMVKNKEYSRLFNYLNTGDAGMLGTGPFSVGIETAENWELENHFIPLEDDPPYFLAGCATLRSIYKR